MIDIHCHILPGIDDGAGNVDEAEAMIGLSCDSGVSAMYLTPHFYPDKCNIDLFLTERNKAWAELDSALGSQKRRCQIRLGAELCYCERMLSMDLRKLTLGESDYLLLELPPYSYPAYLPQIIETLLGKGITPILAHVERYTYFRREPELLKRLIDMGALAQVSIQALFDRRDKSFSMACMRHGLAQIVASDAHNTTDRRPCMELLDKLPKELKQLHKVFSAAVWENELPPYIPTTNLKMTAFGYR